MIIIPPVTIVTDHKTFFSHFSPKKKIIDYFKGLLMRHHLDIFMPGKNLGLNGLMVMKLLMHKLYEAAWVWDESVSPPVRDVFRCYRSGLKRFRRTHDICAVFLEPLDLTPLLLWPIVLSGVSGHQLFLCVSIGSENKPRPAGPRKLMKGRDAPSWVVLGFVFLSHAEINQETFHLCL